MAMKNYTQFLGKHPVWGNEAVTAQYPVREVKVSRTETTATTSKVHGRRANPPPPPPMKESRHPTFTQATWWPSGKTTLYQYCKCHENKNSSRYKTKRLRRNHCPECGYWQNKHDEEYDWDPVVDKTKGKPELGNVIEAVHDIKGFSFDQNHKNSGLLTEKQSIVGKAREIGGQGLIGESYDANLHTRQMDTSTPDGPAYYRMKERNNTLQQQMEDKRKADLIAKVQKKTESQLRNEARNREPKVIEGMTLKFEWELGEPMPYGARDKPEKEVEGPARRRLDNRIMTKMELMKQPHNVTDQVAYCKGNILKEMQEEEKAGRIGKALKYYQRVSEGRKGVLKEIMEEDRANESKRKMEEKKVIEERRLLREQEAKKNSVSKGSMGRGNVKDRMMARTTFGMKSLHSDKYVEQKRRQMSKFLTVGDDEEEKKRRRRKKKKREKREKAEAEEERKLTPLELEEKKEKEEMRARKKERRRQREIEKVVQGTKNVVGLHREGKGGGGGGGGGDKFDDEGSVGR